MSWNIAQAKQQFSEVVRLTAEEPQMIYNRDRCVAAVIDAATFEEFDAWRKKTARKTLGEEFAELRRIAAGDPDPLPVIPRHTRSNPFIEVLDELSD